MRAPMRRGWIRAPHHFATVVALGSACSLLTTANVKAQPQPEAPVEVEASSPAEAPVEVEATTPAEAVAPPAAAAVQDAAVPATPASKEAASDAPEEVTVLGSRLARAPGSAQVVKQRTLERLGHDDPLNVVQTVPGVYVRVEDGVGLRPNIGLRGANPDRSKKVTLMEDGVLFGPAPYSAPAAYYFPMITRMYQVAVTKGSSAIVYGPQTVGGALDLVTRPIPTTAQGRVDLAVGEYGYGKFHGYYGWSDEQTGFLVEGVHLRNDGFKELPSGNDTGFFRNEWMVKLSRVLDPNAALQQTLRLKLTYTEEDSNETYLGLSEADFRANPNRRYAASALDRMRFHRTAVALTHEAELSRNARITTTAYRNDFYRVWRKVNGFRGANLFDVLTQPETAQNAVFRAILRGDASSTTPAETLLVGPNDRNFVSEGIQSRIQVRAKTGPIRHELEYGFRLHYDRIERRHSEDGFFAVQGELIPEGGPTIVTAFNEAWSEAVAMNAFDAMTFHDLTLTPGVRVELIRSEALDKVTGVRSGNTSQAVLPGVGVFQGLLPELGVFAGVYRGFSPPPPGNPESQGPELSVNYEAGARFARRALRAEVVGYYNDYSNLTDVCTFSSGCLDADLDRQFDAGRARIYGLEATAEHEPRFGRFRFPLNASYTLTFAEFARSFDSEDPIFGRVSRGDELPYVPRHQAYGLVAAELDQGGVFASGTLVSRMRERAGSEPLGETLATDRQLTVDFGAKLRPLSFLELYASLRNAFNSRALVSRRPFGARPNAPRWFQLGAKLSF
jgi:Fe(3+) dicitrate transport protein